MIHLRLGTALGAVALLMVLAVARAETPQTNATSAREQNLNAAWIACDAAELASVQQELAADCAKRPQDFAVQIAMAECCLYRADLLRNRRKIEALESTEDKQLRANQEAFGKQGQPVAEQALALAKNKLDHARAERVLGELLAHQITGPVSGMTKGPEALQHISNAMLEAPEDVECQGSQGLMYLYNPPINGGDVEQAIKTFRGCIDNAAPGTRTDHYYLYLAQAYLKQSKLLQARLAAQQALERNPLNHFAATFLNQITAGSGS